MEREVARVVGVCALGAGLALGTFSAPTSAQEPAPDLTLAEARRLAADRGWALLSARSDVTQAEGQRVQAHALPNPQVSFNAAKINLTPPQDGGSTSDTIVGTSQLVELGGKRSSRVRVAEAGLAAAEGRLYQTRAVLDAAVVKAYVAALAAEQTARVSHDSAESLARAAGIADVRFEAGEISAAERDQTRVAAGRFAADARSAQAAAVQARLALQMLLGEPAPGGEVRLADDLESLSRLVMAAAAAPGPQGDVTALDARGDVRAARAAADQARAQVDLQRAQRVPDPTLLVQYESDRPGNPNMLGVGVAVPVPLFNRYRGATAAAEAAREQAEREARRARAQAQADLAAARAALGAALERRRLLHDDLLPRAASVRETVAFAYEKGSASLLELLEAERSLNDVRLAALASQSEALSAAADVAAARGETLP
ncbi:MAG TPA: TolC family protein [Vicinamibacteria bacterium]|nr:TolC family protein [Vicinamibacteria bacterium]